MIKIELKTDKLFGFSKKIALRLLTKKAESIKHYWIWCQKDGLKKGYCSKGYAKEHYTEDLEILNTSKQQEYNLKNFQEIKTALKKGRLVLSCTGGLYWSIDYIQNNKMQGIGLIDMKTLCSYPLNYDKGAYHMACYGTSRPLEIILAYGHNLGLKKINQHQKEVY